MNSSSQRNDSRRLLLYREASQLSSSLQELTVEMLPKLSQLDDAVLLDVSNQYADTLLHLHDLSEQIERTPGMVSDHAACETLRKEIRTALDAAAALMVPCRTALQQRGAEAKRDLLLTQKKRQISAYMRSPTHPQDDGNFFDRRR